jgi:hypothetical protein
MNEKVRIRIKDVLTYYKAKVNSISQSASEQRRLNRQINEEAGITFETISSIIETFSDIDANWLITGNGEMLKANKEEPSAPDAFSKEQYLLQLYEESKIVSYAQLEKKEEENKELTKENARLMEEIGRLKGLLEAKTNTKQAAQKEAIKGGA